MTIRIAVIGAGIMGLDHARIIAEDLPGVTLQVVCDASEPRARAVAEAFGAADLATDAAAVIARTDVDAVVIASPDATHAPLRWPVSLRASRCCVRNPCRNPPPTACKSLTQRWHQAAA